MFKNFLDLKMQRKMGKVSTLYLEKSEKEKTEESRQGIIHILNSGQV